MFCFNKTQLITSGVPFPSFVPLPLPSYPRHNLARGVSPAARDIAAKKLSGSALYCSNALRRSSALPSPYVTLSPSVITRLYPACLLYTSDAADE